MAGLFDLILSTKDAITKDNITTSKELYNAMFSGPESDTGVAVSPESAMRYTTALSCVRVLSESVAQLPLMLYKARSDGGKDRADDHPLYQVLHDKANGWNTAYEYKEGQMVNLATRGNGYAFIERDSKGRTSGLIPLNPDGIEIKQAGNWSPLYTAVMPNNQRRTLKSSEIHHIRGPMPIGYKGQSIISLARNAIGLGLAAEKFGSHLYKNGVKPSGVLKHPGAIGPEATQALREQFEEKYGGLANSSRPLVLEEGMEWVALSINPDDAQFLDTRKFQRSEIAGVFRVPLHMIGDLDRSTNNNIEHQSLEYVMHCLMPWLVRIASAANRDLLTARERAEGYFCEFLPDALLRGDFKSRMEGYAQQIQNGIRSPNEVRSLENMNPREGGDEYWRPTNMFPPTEGTPAAAQG